MLAFVLLFAQFSVTSYATDNSASYWDYREEGYFLPCPTYPSAESLPYGVDTEIYEFIYWGSNSEQSIIFRCYLAPNSYTGTEISVFNGNSALVSSDLNDNIELFVTSNSVIYYQWNTLNRTTGTMSWGNILTANDVLSSGTKSVNKFTDGNKFSSDFSSGMFSGVVYGTDECLFGGRSVPLLIKPTNKIPSSPLYEVPLYNENYFVRSRSLSYITSADLSSKNIADAVDESNEKVINQIKEESAKQITAINESTDKIVGSLEQNGEKLDDINGSVQQNGEKLDELNTEVKSLPEKILDGIKGLFIPTEEEMIEIRDKWDLLMQERFGALYQAGDIVKDLAEEFTYKGEQTTIKFPTVNVNLKGSFFRFGGWTVNLIPSESTKNLLTTVKLIIGIVCTLLFINMLRNKFNKIVGDNT